MSKDYTIALKFTGKTGGFVRTVKALGKTIEKDLTLATGKVETSAGRIKSEFHGAAKAVQPMVKSLNSAVSVSDRLTNNFNKIAAASKKAASIKAQTQTSAMLTGKLTDIVRARTIKPPPLPKQSSVLSEASLPKTSLWQKSAGLIGKMAGGIGKMASGALKIATGFGKAAWFVGGSLISGLAMVIGPVFKIAKSIFSGIVGGFKLAFKWVGKIAKGLLHLPVTGLKFLAAGGAAIYAAHKALSPAAEMERYKVQLDVMKKGNLYDFLTKASAGKPFQMGETVQAGVMMEAFKIPAKQFLGTVMDAAAGFKKPLEEIVRMLGYARSGRTGEALESSARIGITRSDLRKFGIRFEKSGAATADTAGKLMGAMVALMKSRSGGMANRIGTTTYEGAVSDFKDSLFRAFAGASEKFLPYATKIVRNVSAVVANIGKKLKTLPWAEWGKKLADGVKAAGNVINNLMDKNKREKIGGSIGKAWSDIKPLLPKLGAAIKLDLLDAFKMLKPKVVDMMVAAAKLAIEKIKQLVNPNPTLNKNNPVIAGASQKITRREIAINAIRRERAKNGTDKNSSGRLRPITTKEWQDWLKNRDKKNWRDVEKKREQGRFARAQNDFKTDMGRLSKSEQSRFDNAKTVEAIKELRKQITAERAPKKPLAPRTVETAKKIIGKVKPVIKTATQTPEAEKIPLSLIKAGRDTGYVNGKAVALDSKQLAKNAEVQKKIATQPDKYRLADPKGDAIRQREAEAEKRRQAREKVNADAAALLNPSASKYTAEMLKQVVPQIFGQGQSKNEKNVFGRDIKEVTAEIKAGNSDQNDLLKRLERQLILLNKKFQDNNL